MKRSIVLYISTLVVMTILDMVWLGGIARGFYQDRMGSMMEFRMVPAVLFYLMYAAGIVFFVHGRDGGRWRKAAFYGAFFGFFAYGTYDLTNLATLRGWAVDLALVDMAWGVVVTAAAAAAGRFIAGRMGVLGV